MPSYKPNCWEHKKCERESGGKKAAELGVCPAASDSSFDEINSGKNAGRICWAVAGTFCGGKVQGAFAEKRISCIGCDFFKKVQKEEGDTNSQTKFLSFISEDKKSLFLNRLTYRHIKAGERFIIQGEVGEAAFIIQRGSCLVIVEKDGVLHPVGHRGKGDIVGVTTILTGEVQGAHVEAETDMDLWVLNSEQFNDISNSDPELLHFLSELVASRFDSRRPTADRAIGKYLATDIIGRGAFSIVYRGIHTGLNMPVIIKMMRHNMALNNDFLENFHNEAKTIASLKHENIIRVYDIEERYRTLFIIEECLEGETLKDMLERLKTVTPSVAANFIIQICNGLEYAHHRGIVHRDINPSNIFVQWDDQIKIVDFGLSCPVGTEDMEFSGTIHYMSPEQIESEVVDQRTDIYGLGITAYEILTGNKPYQEDDINLLMQMHLTQEIPDPGEIVQDLPDELRRFIIKACHRDPDQRYQDMGHALKELQPLVDKFALTRNGMSAERQRMITLFLTYGDAHQHDLSQLLEEFSNKVKKLGIDLKAADIRDM
ncbi:MAG: protein kinase [Deltaproteobacteria bacterium]|nr:protein kinase [Deltaproteobacteria bacterium]